MHGAVCIDRQAKRGNEALSSPTHYWRPRRYAPLGSLLHICTVSLMIEALQPRNVESSFTIYAYTMDRYKAMCTAQ